MVQRSRADQRYLQRQKRYNDKDDANDAGHAGK
jgi:hypothetical protein